MKAESVDQIKSIDVNLGDAIKFASFKEDTFKFSIDGAKLTENFVGQNFLIMITLTSINDKEFKQV